MTTVILPLEDSPYIHCAANHELRHLELDLPQSNLQFYHEIGGHETFARQYPGMVVDENQSLETLVGLQSKLLLRNKQGNRLIIIPEGDVHWMPSKGHIVVDIRKRTVSRVHSYTIDE